MNLPASPTARRAEEMVRARQRMEALDRVAAMERTLDTAIMEMEAASAPSPTPEPIEPTADDVTFVGEVLASYDSIPVGHTCSWTSRRDAPPLVTALSVAGLGAFSIADAIRVGLLTTGGSFVRSTYERLLAERPGNSGRWLHPSGNAANPVFEPLRQSTD
jgi:hypothetical protein